MIRRMIIRVIVFLLLGAIINVAVAWGCAAYVDPIGARSFDRAAVLRSDGHDYWELVCARRFGVVVFHSARTHDSYSLARRIPFRPNVGDINRSLPSWCDLELPHTSYMNAESAYEERHVLAAGWPYLAQWCDLFRWVSVSVNARTAYQAGPLGAIPTSLDPWHGYLKRALPLRPIWPGFATNTIFYAGVLWLVFATPGFVKRRLRRVRGRCIHCCYDLRGQPPDSNKCPECGITV